jgi:hypothetical protein
VQKRNKTVEDNANKELNKKKKGMNDVIDDLK